MVITHSTQGLIRLFIKEKGDDDITPVQFDDILGWHLCLHPKYYSSLFGSLLLLTVYRIGTWECFKKEGRVYKIPSLDLPPQPRLTGGYHNRIESLGTDSQLILTSRV